MNKFNKIVAVITGGQCDTCQNKKVLHPDDNVLITYYQNKKKKFTKKKINKGKPYLILPPIPKHYCHWFDNKPDDNSITCPRYNLESNTKIKIASQKIKHQFNKGSEAQFMFAIIEQSYDDFIKTNDKEARIFLNSEMPHAEICGINSAWIRDILRNSGFNIQPEGKI